MNYYMPTRIITGKNCITKNACLFHGTGKKPLIVCGKSAAKCGALNDVVTALTVNEQEYAVFDGVTPNPTVDCVRKGIAALRENGCDFIVAIGGGSPMDAAKSMAMFALDRRTDEEIFNGKYGEKALPIIAVPTTAGTGSEVTQYSILTNDFSKTKTSVKSPALFPKIAFLDGKYMANLPVKTQLNTALDALSHAVEGMFSVNASPLSDMFAKKAMGVIFPLLKKITEGTLTAEEKDELLLAAAYAGVTIAQSGTIIVHGMGYALTYFYDVDHGRANGLTLGAMLAMAESYGKEKVKEVCSSCGVKDVKEFSGVLSSVLGERDTITGEELELFTQKAVMTGNYKLCDFPLTPSDVFFMYRTSLTIK